MTAVQALQVALEAEHAAMHGYGVLGGVTSTSAQPALAGALEESYEEHRALRDALTARIRDLGGTPVPAAASYALPPRLGGPAGVRAAARGIEERCAATYAATVAGTTGADRRRAAAALRGAALRGLRFGAEPDPFPGATGLAT